MVPLLASLSTKPKGLFTFTVIISKGISKLSWNPVLTLVSLCVCMRLDLPLPPPLVLILTNPFLACVAPTGGYVGDLQVQDTGYLTSFSIDGE